MRGATKLSGLLTGVPRRRCRRDSREDFPPYAVNIREVKISKVVRKVDSQQGRYILLKTHLRAK